MSTSSARYPPLSLPPSYSHSLCLCLCLCVCAKELRLRQSGTRAACQWEYVYAECAEQSKRTRDRGVWKGVCKATGWSTEVAKQVSVFHAAILFANSYSYFNFNFHFNSESFPFSLSPQHDDVVVGYSSLHVLWYILNEYARAACEGVRDWH